MIIKEMFRDDINRNINGVVKVDQDESSILAQEINEYVVTKEIKRHMITFFNAYNDAFQKAESDIVCSSLQHSHTHACNF